jgi:rhamnosyltransferase subunit B
MANIILVTKGTYGDVVPFLVLGRALRHRGNHVTLISHCHYRDAVLLENLDFDSWDDERQYWDFIRDGPLLDTPRGMREFASKHIVPQFAREFHVIRSHCHQRETIIVARHMADLAARAVAELSDIPLATVYTAVAQVECLPLLNQLYEKVLGDTINACRGRVGLPKIDNWELWTRGSACSLGCWPSWFAETGRAWPEKFANLGFLDSAKIEHGPLPSVVTELLNDVRGVILISGGTAVSELSRKFYQVSMEGCSSAQFNALLVCRHEDLVPQKLLPGTVYFKHLPFASLMPRVAAVVHHGGTSILVRALMAGIPQIALPFGGDRPSTSRRLEQLGVCLRLATSEWSPEAVANGIRKVLDSPSISEACARMRARANTANQLSEGCRVVEACAASPASGPLRCDKEDNEK